MDKPMMTDEEEREEQDRIIKEEMKIKILELQIDEANEKISLWMTICFTLLGLLIVITSILFGVIKHDSRYIGEVQRITAEGLDTPQFVDVMVNGRWDTVVFCRDRRDTESIILYVPKEVDVRIK